MNLVRAIDICDACRRPRAGVGLGTSRGSFAHRREARRQEVRVPKSLVDIACARTGSSGAAKILFCRKLDGPCFAGRKPAATAFANSIS